MDPRRTGPGLPRGRFVYVVVLRVRDSSYRRGSTFAAIAFWSCSSVASVPPLLV